MSHLPIVIFMLLLNIAFAFKWITTNDLNYFLALIFFSGPFILSYIDYKKEKKIENEIKNITKIN